MFSKSDKQMIVNTVVDKALYKNFKNKIKSLQGIIGIKTSVARSLLLEKAMKETIDKIDKGEIITVDELIREF